MKLGISKGVTSENNDTVSDIKPIIVIEPTFINFGNMNVDDDDEE